MPLAPSHNGCFTLLSLRKSVFLHVISHVRARAVHSAACSSFHLLLVQKLLILISLITAVAALALAWVVQYGTKGLGYLTINRQFEISAAVSVPLSHPGVHSARFMGPVWHILIHRSSLHWKCKSRTSISGCDLEPHHQQRT